MLKPIKMTALNLDQLQQDPLIQTLQQYQSNVVPLIRPLNSVL